ncbi:MAG: 23S rRNA (uridine(2552)-2'-O)-methyltransferase RlmE [Gammaproteobacteria bacterium]|nr:23S rRNA (uridine(2552)-2'-O)-methyltransferase RlmE [Gammaproteobacteria bacterium]MCH9717197.1 23S rRNA (uridine(2552)-2'-O)-methyltransferase RlmE [Gammaproteobacteria bacterium]MCH9763861.1 23S rRNA (uridine(2552)-2'-O)-methyltransferase RlmE [Gammaproteobacteria bacterium]
MPRSKSSQKWLREHFDDVYVKQAQREGYRSRAVYKLKELDEKKQLLKPGMSVVDLGAAPGGWTQYVAEKLGACGQIIALDILPMDSLPDVVAIEGDFHDDAVFKQLMDAIPSEGVDVILSDMAPNLSGNVAIDIPRAMALSELAFDLASKILKPGGTLLIKVFHGASFDALLKMARIQFQTVMVKKPAASRSRSRETYLLAKGYDL